MPHFISIQTNNFDLNTELALLDKIDSNCGAIVNFIGKVRGSDHKKPLSHLFITHLPKATELAIEKIILVAEQRFSLTYSKVIHRIGNIFVGEQIVMVLTASLHRHDAYLANRFIMDYLKTEAPFWKKECFIDHSENWVEMKQSDLSFSHQWQENNDK